MESTVRSDSGVNLGQRISELAKVLASKPRTAREKEQGGGEISKGNRAKRSRYTTNAGAKGGSTSKEPETPLLSKHQKLKLLVAELPTLVDLMTQDFLDQEKAVISLRASQESADSEMNVWQQLYKQHKVNGKQRPSFFSDFDYHEE